MTPPSRHGYRPMSLRWPPWRRSTEEETYPRTCLTLYMRYGTRAQVILNTPAMPRVTTDLAQAMRGRTPYLLTEAAVVILAVQGEDLLAFTALPDTTP